MPLITISIGVQQQRALEQNTTRAGEGSASSKITRAIDQYLAGPKQIEAAFLKLLEIMAPKDLPALLPLQAKLKKTLRKIDRTIALMTASERRIGCWMRWTLRPSDSWPERVRFVRQGLYLTSSPKPNVG